MKAERLRVLVVLPFYGGSLPIGRYCTSALRSLGHVVEEFDAPAFHSAFSALNGLRVTANRLEQLEGAFLQVISQSIMAKVETFEPDLVLALAQAPMSRTLLRRLKREGIPTAMWFVEDYKIFTYWRAFAPLYDVFAIIQREPFLTELAQAGQPNALYLPMAALAEFHKPLELNPVEQRIFGADIGFLGAGYPNRRAAFRPLASQNFKIWGTEWDGENQLARNVQRGGARISAEDSVKIYNATRININLHSSVQARELVPHGDFVNPRTFELAAMQAFQLVDKRACMPDLFAEDELATFSSVTELYEKIEYFLRHPQESVEYAARARQRVLRDHTYQQRMCSLLDFVSQCLPGWPRPRSASAFPQDMPEALQRELAHLLQSVHLPADADFEDLIARLRQQTGALGGLETSLLFMDEWRKQYKTKS
ncbi:MAG: glycosyltransferase [Desulfovibrionaceae bacterium]